jgi:hypothetical protein
MLQVGKSIELQGVTTSSIGGDRLQDCPGACSVESVG